MISVTDITKINFDSVPIDESWNTGNEKELKMHRIHAYPAKFPAFITTKALEYAKKNDLEPSRIADIFCGCGTVALEAKRNNVKFWGCDLNPVATLIAKTKSFKYQHSRLLAYYQNIMESYKTEQYEIPNYRSINPRIKYWFDSKNYRDLSRLKLSILSSLPKRSPYLNFFLCAFSNILKPTSNWLTKSIKPQVDPDKKRVNVIACFKKQCNTMFDANMECDLQNRPESTIVNNNFLNESLKRPNVDMIITSPPYVTSYEYADLHQLSSIWLDYSSDYRELRQGSIGSLYHEVNFCEVTEQLNVTGSKIVKQLMRNHKSKARSVAKYFRDMQLVAKHTYDMLGSNGMALFVIGNTEYKSVRIDNARHLTESLLDNGFSQVLVTKRRISKKILTPYRDRYGCFSTNSKGRKVYSEEFILIGRI